ncbi:hypothetical protein niasHT_015428 [Heterodera trifolii]|uniref:Uncharacterized protein n=1 Tax=Heterodera trifolii TaxID=157864 RepID=A0ABD2L089_9BILA
MSYCSLIPKFAQIGSAQSLCPSIAKKCTNSAPSASSTAFSTSTYMGSGYRSVAFGTWAVGDASRCFEGRRRGKSATALESGRMGRTTDEEGKENGRREENEEKGGRKEKNVGKEEEEEREDRRERKGRREEEREKRKRHRNKEKGEGGGRRRRARRGGESGREGKEGKGGAERGESDSSVSPSADRFRLSTSNLRSVPSATDHRRRPSPTLSRSLCDISADRKTMQTALMRRREPDLYSSSEYVRHNYGTSGRAAEICHEKVAAVSHAVSPFCPSSVSSAAFAHRPHNAGCSLEALFVPPLRCPVPLSPCPSRISCPPLAQRPLRHILHPKHNNLSPNSLCHSHHQQQQFSFVIDPLGRETQRKRTKSLDNGLKLSLGTAIRRRKDRICEGVPPAEHQAESVPGSRKSAICESDQLSTGASESRLEAAKNFLRRFYNHSTLRLTGRRRRRGNGTKRGDADKGTAEPPLMYSSALGPFFEMRKPQPAEMPFLPYNIHYTIESTDEASGASDDDADGAVAAVRRPLRAVSPQSEWSCTPTCSSVTITSPNRAEMTTTSTHSQNSNSCMAITANSFKQRQNAANANGGETYQQQQQHNHQHRHQRQFELTSSRTTSAGAQLFSPVLPFFPSVPNSVPQMAPLSPISPSSPQHFVHTYPFQHQQSANDSLLNETVPTTPSVGYGSLKSSSDSSEGRRDNDGTAEKRRMIGPAEKRFADWNELFQYLKREIMEMNARDAQILRRLEGIQFELNGVRQMSGQPKRRPK